MTEEALKKNRLRGQDTIEIVIRGPKKFRQALMDKIYELLMEDDFVVETTKPGCGYTLTSSISPSNEI